MNRRPGLEYFRKIRGISERNFPRFARVTSVTRSLLWLSKPKPRNSVVVLQSGQHKVVAMMVAKIISVLACLVSIHEARAKDGGSDGCSDFPFASDPFWGGAEAEFPESELLLMERNSSLFTGELRLTHGEKEDLSDPLRNRLPEFVRCWKGRGFVEVTLTDGEGKESGSVVPLPQPRAIPVREPDQVRELQGEGGALQGGQEEGKVRDLPNSKIF